MPRNTCVLMFISVLLTIAEVWDQPRCPSMDEWIKKMWYISKMENYSARKKKEILSSAPK
jgi:hypothetical protein